MTTELAHVEARFFTNGDEADPGILDDLVNYDWLLVPDDEDDPVHHITNRSTDELDAWVEFLPPPAEGILHPPHTGRALRSFVAIRVSPHLCISVLADSLENVGQDILEDDARELVELARYIRSARKAKPGATPDVSIDFPVVYSSACSYDEVEHTLLGLCIGFVAAMPGQTPSFHKNNPGCPVAHETLLATKQAVALAPTPLVLPE